MEPYESQFLNDLIIALFLAPMSQAAERHDTVILAQNIQRHQNPGVSFSSAFVAGYRTDRMPQKQYIHTPNPKMSLHPDRKTERIA